MQQHPWEECHYHKSGSCLQQSAIDRVHLIPQLLDPVDLEAAKATCQSCAKYLDEKRKHFRLERPLQITLIKEDGTATEGSIVNLSEGGALVKLENCANLYKGERVDLEIYPSHKRKQQVPSNKIRVSSLIKRLETEKNRLVAIFLNEIA